MRRRQAFKRTLIPDVRYNNEMVARLINTIMLKGKKSVAQEIVYGAFDILKQKRPDLEPLELFLAALENAKVKTLLVRGEHGKAVVAVDVRRSGRRPGGKPPPSPLRWRSRRTGACSRA